MKEAETSAEHEIVRRSNVVREAYSRIDILPLRIQHS